MMLTLLGLAAVGVAVGLDSPVLLGAWLLVGVRYSAVSHTCWLVTYPLSGGLMTQFGAVAAVWALAGIGTVSAFRHWPQEDLEILEHSQDKLPLDHLHLNGARRHAHPFVVDDQHPR